MPVSLGSIIRVIEDSNFKTPISLLFELDRARAERRRAEADGRIAEVDERIAEIMSRIVQQRATAGEEAENWYPERKVQSDGSRHRE